MSTQTLSYSELFERARNMARGLIQTHVMRVQGLIVLWDTQEAVQPQATSGETANASNTNWLSSIVGAFDNNPLYPQILENERQARLMDDEQFIILE